MQKLWLTILETSKEAADAERSDATLLCIFLFRLSNGFRYVINCWLVFEVESEGLALKSCLINDNSSISLETSKSAHDMVVDLNNLSDAFRAREAGNVRILGVADIERSDFLPDVPTMAEQGLDVDNSSVNFRGIMVPKGTPQDVIDRLAAKVPEMFANRRVAGKMKAGGSPMHILTREQVQAMWAAREETLKELLAGL